jgi:hypothetical protein
MAIHDLSPLAAIVAPPARPLAAIIIFHAAGDILNATLISAQLRRDHPDYYIVFITCARYRTLLDHNPDLDQVIALVGEPAALDLDIPAIKAYQPWVEVFVPAAYFSPRLAQGWSIYRVTREPVGITLQADSLPVLVLSEAEQKAARAYWATLPPGPKLLIETEFNSNQSPWNDDYVEALGEILAPLGIIFIFTALNRPPFLDDFQQRFGHAFWCSLPFRLNVELFNLADALIGVSSGISVAVSSGWCRRDTPWIEICHGQLWSHVEIPVLRDFQICNDLPRFRDALARIAHLVGGQNGTPNFAPRFRRAEGDKVAYCPLCGSRDCVPIRGGAIVECPSCALAFAPRREQEEQSGAGTTDIDDLIAALAARLPAANAHLPRVICRHCDGDLAAELSEGVEPSGSQLLEGRIGSILAADMIDRLSAPFEWLEQANYALAPDGRLLVRVWNFGGFLSTVGGLDCLGPTANLCFFTIDSLRRVLQLAGFLVERQWTETPAAELPAITAALQSFDGLDPGNPAAWAKDLAAVDKGERIVIIARKRGPSQHRILLSPNEAA